MLRESTLYKLNKLSHVFILNKWNRIFNFNFAKCIKVEFYNKDCLHYISVF